jgi:hypothetical protein
VASLTCHTSQACPGLAREAGLVLRSTTTSPVSDDDVVDILF